jgi:hypothetical protein
MYEATGTNVVGNLGHRIAVFHSCAVAHCATLPLLPICRGWVQLLGASAAPTAGKMDTLHICYEHPPPLWGNLQSLADDLVSVARFIADCFDHFQSGGDPSSYTHPYLLTSCTLLGCIV